MLKRFLRGEELRKFLKFGLVGVLNTLVDYAVFWLVGFLTPSLYLAQTAGYAAGVLNSYLCNRSFTFHSRKKLWGAAFLKFLAVNLCSYLASLAALWLLADYWGLNRYLAKIFLVGVTLTVNFVLNRLWVFREDAPPENGPPTP